MIQIEQTLEGAQSHLSNLRHARSSVEKPGAMMNLAQLDGMIAEQEKIVADLLSQTFK